jgi:drug/metabolite transporter (DMT)-like permease
MAGLRGKALAAYLIVCIVWGSTYLAIRVGVTHLPPFLFAGTRFLIAGTILGGIALATGARLPRERRTWAGIVILGAFFLLGGNGGVVWAEQFVPSGLASVYVVTVTIWSVLFDGLIPGGNARISARVILGLAAGLFGSILLVGVSPRELLAADWRGPIALTLASASWALGTVFAKRRPLGLPVVLGAALQMLAGGALLTTLGLAQGESLPAQVPGEAVAAYWYLVVFGSIIAFTAFSYALKHASATVVGTYAYVNPVVAVLLGWAILDEPITGRTMVAMALMLGSVALIQFGDSAKPPDQPDRPYAMKGDDREDPRPSALTAHPSSRLSG